VLEIEELADHEHLAGRSTVIQRDGGGVEAATAPRLAAWRPELAPRPKRRGGDTAAVLREAGFSDAEVAGLATEGAIGL
jgi:crotonobetainyl-CoA:carnitine CoA-transferase CaiB-like acyl-CoA transferase